MPAVKLNISLEQEVAKTLRRRAAEMRKSTSRYLADLIEADARRYRDDLAAEGYRMLESDTGEFAAAAWPLAGEMWTKSEDAAASAAGQGDQRDSETEAR